MKQRPLSATSIKLFLECLQKFYFNYYTDKEKVIRGDSLPFGIAVHESLEEMERYLGEKNRKPIQEDYEYIYSYFIDQGVSAHLSDMNLYEEGKYFLKERMDKYDPSVKVLGLELRFGSPSTDPKIIATTSKGTPLAGAIDKITEYDSDTLVITDYKTSRVAMTKEDAENDIQISMYDLVASRLFPKYKHIIVVMDYLRLEPVITHRTEEQRVLFEELCDVIYNKLGEMDKPEFKPRLNNFCGWCDFKAYCPSYKKSITDPDLKIKPTSDMKDSDFVDEWLRLADVKRVLDDYSRSLKMSLQTRMCDRDLKEVTGRTHSLYRVQRGSVSYNVEKAYDLLDTKDFLSVVSIRKREMDKYLSDRPEIAKEMTKSSSVSFGNPYFKQRKLK